MKTYLIYNGITAECFPKNALKLSNKKNNDEVFFRRELVDNLIFVDDEINNHFDYSVITNQSIFTKFIFSIPDENFSATFFITDGEVDSYRKTITIKPTTLDEYTYLDSIINKTVNVAASGSDSTFYWKGIKPTMVSYLRELSRNNDDEPTISEINMTILSGTGLYRENYRLASMELIRNAVTGLIDRAGYEWIQEQIVVLDTDLQPLSSDLWVEVTYNIPGFRKYVRPFGGNMYIQYTRNTVQLENTVVTNSYTLNYDETELELNVYGGAISLRNMFYNYLYRYIGIDSIILNSDINPLRPDDWHYSLKNLFVVIKSNFLLDIARYEYDMNTTEDKEPFTYDPAKKAEITLKAMLDYLYKQLGLKYDVVNGKLRIEHEIFYLNNNSYSGEQRVTIDIRNIGIESSIYSFKSDDRNHTSEYSCSESGTKDFRKHTIVWDDTLSTDSEVESRTMDIFTTDIDYVFSNISDVSKDGFVLLHCEKKSDGAYYVLHGLSRYGEGYISNGYISIIECMDNYFIYNGTQYSGTLTYDKAFILDSYGTPYITKWRRKIKYQKNVIIPKSYFNLYAMYITNLGQGIVEEAEEDLDNGTVNLTLLYD